jgi:hypothetical protein
MRFAIVIVAALMGIAAPARAWCEASCLAPAQHGHAPTKPHCPTHEPAGDRASISASEIDDCPVIESARQTTVARLDLKATVVASPIPQLSRLAEPIHVVTFSSPVTTVFERHTPLRI